MIEIAIGFVFGCMVSSWFFCIHYKPHERNANQDQNLYWYMKGKNNGRDEILKENLIRQKRHQSVSYKNLLIKDDTGLLI